MASVADRKRRRKTRTAIEAEIVVADRRAGTGLLAGERGRRGPAPGSTFQARITGLQHMAKKGALTPPQVAAGDRYGVDYRWAIMESGVSVPSSLAGLEGAHIRGAGGDRIGPADYSAIMIQARRDIALARSVLGFEDHMVLACDMVCGRQVKPGEVTKSPKEVHSIEVSLELALNLLVRHYASQDRKARD